MTNSLLCSGDPETLTRLRELIKSLDVPLKQVFIEMLVIETTLSNALTFGLEWASRVQVTETNSQDRSITSRLQRQGEYWPPPKMASWVCRDKLFWIPESLTPTNTPNPAT